jgi:ribosome maturation protein Sdo1
LANGRRRFEGVYNMRKEKLADEILKALMPKSLKRKINKIRIKLKIQGDLFKDELLNEIEPYEKILRGESCINY